MGSHGLHDRRFFKIYVFHYIFFGAWLSKFAFNQHLRFSTTQTVQKTVIHKGLRQNTTFKRVYSQHPFVDSLLRNAVKLIKKIFNNDLYPSWDALWNRSGRVHFPEVQENLQHLPLVVRPNQDQQEFNFAAEMHSGSTALKLGLDDSYSHYFNLHRHSFCNATHIILQFHQN